MLKENAADMSSATLKNKSVESFCERINVIHFVEVVMSEMKSFLGVV